MRRPSKGGIDPDTQRMIEGLSATLRAAKIPRRALERQLGWSAGYVSRVLNGPIELKASHLFAILRAIGKPPAEFFRETFPPHTLLARPQAVALERLAPHLDRAEADLNEMDARIRKVVLELFQDLLRGAAPAPLSVAHSKA